MSTPTDPTSQECLLEIFLLLEQQNAKLERIALWADYQMEKSREERERDESYAERRWGG